MDPKNSDRVAIPVTTEQLLRTALSRNPDCLIYGEVRSAQEAAVFLKNKHSGRITTLHASNSEFFSPMITDAGQARLRTGSGGTTA
jgi:type IV secretory pathway ATPase VirB11/archaellum biosynthesis ATPase